MKESFLPVPAYRLTSAAGKSLLQTDSFQLPLNSIVAITGPSGAGKSLFIKSLFGWTSEKITPLLSPASGSYMMIQDPSQGLTPGLSLIGHFKEVTSGPDWRERSLAMLAELGLVGEGLLERHPESFSGGERQRIMVALILMRQPRLLVCDEPAASLDPDNEFKLWRLLRRIRRNRTLIFVTHQLKLIEEYADQVLLIDQGKMVFQGSKGDFFRQPTTPFHQRLVGVYRKTEPEMEPEPVGASTPLVQIDNLRLTFGNKIILDEFSWQIQEQDWWWLAGPSGVGKTSLARLIAGILTPARGQIRIEGRPEAWSLAQRSPETRRKIQYIFQHGSRALNPAVPLKIQLTRAFSNDLPRLKQFLEEVHLDHLNLDKLPLAFSLGEIQRLNLLRALGPRPRLILCDELFVSLDLTLKFEMLTFLKARRRQEGLAVVVITHNQDLKNQQQGQILDLSKMAQPQPLSG